MASASADGVASGTSASANGVSTTAATASEAPIMATGSMSLILRFSVIGPQA